MSHAQAIILSPEPPKESPEPGTLEYLAREMLLTHRIAQNAAGPMAEAVLADEELLHQMMRRLFEGECRRICEADIAGRFAAEKRRTGGGPLGAARATNLAAHAEAVRDALLDGFTLPGGKKLGDATREDLGAAINAYATQEADAAIKGRWLRHVQQSIPTGKLVRDVLSEARVAELRELAKRGDA